MVGTVVWLVGSWGFSEYAAHFGTYNVTYGSIGGVVVLMTWLYLSALLFSIGLEANSHKAIVSMIGDHFVRSGRLSPQMGRLVSRLQRDREDADYASGAVFTPEEAEKAIEAFLRTGKAALPAKRPCVRRA